MVRPSPRTRAAVSAPTVKAAPKAVAKPTTTRKVITRVSAPTVKAAPKAVAKPTVTRKVITQQPAGQAVQQQFKQAVSSAVKSVGVNFGVPTVKATVRETETEIITVIDKPVEEVEIEVEEVEIEEEVIEEEEPLIVLPEIIPEVFGEQEIVLLPEIIQIIKDIENGIILVPDWWKNNTEWVKTGHITQQEFLTAYNYAVDQGWIHPADTALEVEVIDEKVIVEEKPPKPIGFEGASALGLVAVLIAIGAVFTIKGD